MPETDNSDSLLKLLDAYGAHLAQEGKSHKAIIACTTPIRMFVQFLAEKGIAEPKGVTEGVLKDFQKCFYERGYKRSSILFFLQHIRMFFDFLVETGSLERNEARGIEVLPEPGRRGQSPFGDRSKPEQSKEGL